MNDIHALIAAAKREQFSFGGSHVNNLVLEQNSIAMAEALAMIAGYGKPLSQFECEAAFTDMQMIARDALAAVVKEAKP